MTEPPLLSKLVRRSVKLAQPLARAYAEGNMTMEVEITRPAKSTFDRNTGRMTNPPDATVYTGVARMYEVVGGQAYNLGDEPQFYASSYVSIPVSAPRPWANDDVRIVTAEDPALVDRHYRITGVDTGGLLPAVHRCAVIGAEPAQNATP